METADTMLCEELRGKVASLEAELEDQEQKIIQAATFGKSLLEENDELRHRFDVLMKKHAEEQEEKQQELCTLRSQATVNECTKKWQQEEIGNLQAELQQVQHTITQQVTEDKEQEISAYKKQVESLRLDVGHLQGVEQELRTRLSEQEALLQTHLDRTALHSLSATFTCEELAALSEELGNLKMDLTELQSKNIDVSGQLQQCQGEKDTLTSRLKAADLEVDDLQCQVVSYTRHLEEARREVTELRAQLDATMIGNHSHNSKGNSIFSELEDRRVVLETKMASLKVQNQQLKEKYDMEKQLNNKYKMQVAMALQMTHRGDDSAAQRLRGDLRSAHAEIRRLSSQVQELESCKNSKSLQLSDEELMGKMADKNYAQYLMSIIQSEREVATRARGELQGKSMQYLDMANENMKLTQQVRHLEAEKDKLQANLIRVAMEKDELTAKYEPDKTKGGKAGRKVVEKIDLGDLSDLGTVSAGRPSDVFKPLTALGRNATLPTDPSKQRHEKPSFYKTPEEIDPRDNVFPQGRRAEGVKVRVKDAENIFPEGRKVSLADDVKVIHESGEETMATLSVDRERVVSSDSMRKKSSKSAKAARHIRASDAQEVECKTQ